MLAAWQPGSPRALFAVCAGLLWLHQSRSSTLLDSIQVVTALTRVHADWFVLITYFAVIVTGSCWC